MAGILVPLLPKRVFDFSKLQLNTTQTLLIAERIDISQYIDGVIALRVHDAVLTGGTISFDLFGDGYCHEDPTLSFQTSSPFFSSVPVAAAPALLTYGGTVLGHYAALRVSGNLTSASTLSATVSLDLILRTPDDTLPG